MTCTKRGYLFFIILLIGLNNLSADEDITEAISDTTETITTQINDETKDSLRNDRNEDDGVEKKVQNPTEQRLPADSDTIRHNIIDSGFSCDERDPGFYADIENDCQIFHRCLKERKNEVFSFICPEQTVFDQRILVCISDDSYDIPCETSEQYYQESNRAFFGNTTAEESIEENIKNAQEIKSVTGVVEQTVRPMKEKIKFYEVIPTDGELATTNDESVMVEKNSLEEENEESDSVKEAESVSEESNDYQAELIPSSTNHIDASLATSSNSELEDSSFDENPPPQKLISLSVLEPIVELPGDNQTLDSLTSSNIRKRSRSHRNRFSFRADAHRGE